MSLKRPFVPNSDVKQNPMAAGRQWVGRLYSKRYSNVNVRNLLKLRTDKATSVIHAAYFSQL